MNSGFIEWRVAKKATKKIAGVTVKVEAGVAPEEAGGVAVGASVEVTADAESEAVPEEDAVGVVGGASVEVTADAESEAVPEEDAVGVVGGASVEVTAESEAVPEEDAVGVVGGADHVEVEPAVQADEEQEVWESIEELLAWDPEVVTKYKRRRVSSNFVVTRSGDTPKAAKQRKKLAGYNADGRACASALKRLAPCTMGA
eukprot:g8559.t1